MPVTTGTSSVLTQTLQSFQTLTLPQVEITFPSTPTLPSRRVGYFYVWAVDVATPFQTRLLIRDALYRPGVFRVFPNNYGFTNVRYTVTVDWNVSGLAWRCSTA